jgi:NADP-dependent aldehyde dehydrogenase
VLLNERLRDALSSSVAALGELAQAVALPGAPEGPGFRFRPAAYAATAADLVRSPALLDERFGPIVLLLSYGDHDELLDAVARLEGQLTGTVHAGPGDEQLVGELVALLTARAGRVLFDGFPTGVAVTHGMHHGGPYPATTAPGHTSVGMTALRRFQRPVAFQNAPAHVLPAELHDDNPRGIWRRVDGRLTRDPLRRG